ncbi:FRG domain-containing protein [Cardiobacterium sp. Marseille-Q4385]|uniref:FRG domain-containing protein n=1 Tax=Cardiobacterium sp. Marseille-Q4385 TaxID=2866573 RepID=UPI001CE3FFE0|nr:FRG domain-containing protein [Cardiobacterium sp. Marseille-Q4385]
MTDKKQNEVSESKEIPHEINSISDLSQILQTLGEPEKGHTRFFRGHGDESWKLLPSIYRETYLIENEDKIIKDALTYCPDDFLPSDTLFEKLVKLQHYGYSTRLLDLTTNALVALYFSAWNEQHYDKDGELIILDIPDEQIKYGDSDTISILSAISLQSYLFNYSQLQEKSEKNAKGSVDRKILLSIKELSNLGDLHKALLENKPEVGTLLSHYMNGMEVHYEDEFISIFNAEKEIISLLHTIRTDKPHFRPVINPSDFNRVLCVRAKLNNARISRQQGCFLIFGIKDNKTEAAVIPDEWQRLASNNQKILVKAESKADIKQELESFGISKRTLFPELEAQAKEIMDYYKGQK